MVNENCAKAIAFWFDTDFDISGAASKFCF